MKKSLSALTLAVLLSATINAESLWTDEAFSVFIASHRTLGSCWSTLLHGDSSDLQMALYYLYLHAWSQLFGQSEIAFRSANIPFILIYSGVLVWASHRLFRNYWVWVIAALSPLAVVFASDTRPYFDVIALSLACLTCLLAYLQSPSLREQKVLPWLVLACLLLGAMFHMLMLLLAPPLVVVLIVFRLNNRGVIRWQDWKWPLLTFSPLFVMLLGYFAWTFGRGATYDYAHPDLLSMASVLFRFAGLSGYSPNRRYDIPFRPYLGAMALSTMFFAAGLTALFIAWSRSGSRSNDWICFKALLYALAVALAQIFVLSFAVHQQIEFRHLSSLLPLLLLLIMAGLSSGAAKSHGRNFIVVLAAAALGLTWFISDIRLLVSPDYKREDFRSAVRKSLELQNTEVQSGHHVVIAVVADPIAPAYYGLSMEGPAPCFPMTGSCQQELSKVTWPQKAAAQYALFWSDAQIRAWLGLQNRSHSRVILLISRSRHPLIKDSAWWPIVQSQQGAKVYPQHGFFVYLLN